MLLVMTEKDKERVEAARRLNPIDWSYAGVWAREADTEEAREELERIEKLKYRTEEYASGLG